MDNRREPEGEPIGSPDPRLPGDREGGGGHPEAQSSLAGFDSSVSPIIQGFRSGAKPERVLDTPKASDSSIERDTDDPRRSYTRPAFALEGEAEGQGGVPDDPGGKRGPGRPRKQSGGGSDSGLSLEAKKALVARWRESSEGRKEMRDWMAENLMVNMIYEQEEGQGAGQAARMARKQFHESVELVLGMMDEKDKDGKQGPRT